MHEYGIIVSERRVVFMSISLSEKLQKCRISAVFAPCLCRVGVPFGMVFCLLFNSQSALALVACPAGSVKYLGPAVDAMENASGECAPLCDTGVRSVRIKDGQRFDLFAEKSTLHGIAVQHADKVCYVEATAGEADGVANVIKFLKDGTTYVAKPSNGKICPPKYTLSYTCGDGTGTPPASQEIAYGDTFTPGYDFGTCYSGGQAITGWKIGGTTYGLGSTYTWTFTENQEAVPVWGGFYIGVSLSCNSCEYPYVTQIGKGGYGQPWLNGHMATNGSTVCPPSPSSSGGQGTLKCMRPEGAKFVGWDVYNGRGEKEATLGACETYWGIENHQLMFYARWEWDHAAEKRKITFTCGQDSNGNSYAGVPPAEREVTWGELVSFGFDFGTCKRDGYRATGWSMDNGATVFSRTGAFTWMYKEDKTLIPVWTAVPYYAYYMCGAGTTNASYISATYNASITPAASVCAGFAPDGKTLTGYAVYDQWGKNLNVTLTPDTAHTYGWATNVQLRAVYE